MKICALSDTHGELQGLTIKPCDLLLIAGDTVDLRCQKNDLLSKDWYRDNFIPWITSFPCKKIVMVGGNHDFYLESNKEEFKTLIEDRNIVYLENEYYKFEGITIYGTPLCHKFMNWAFMPNAKEQEDIFNKTIDNRHVDILLSHDAPYGYSDICYDASWGRDHIGNPELYYLAMKMNPTYLIHGHLHSSNHDLEELPNQADTKVYNVSILGEDYKQHYEPFYFEI